MTSYIAAAAVSLIGTTCGLYLAARVRKARRLRKEIRELLTRVRDGIAHGGVPLDELYAEMTAGSREGKELLDALKKGSPSEAFALITPYLDIESANLLTSFAARLGRNGRVSEELSSLDRALTALSDIDRRLSSKEDARILLGERLGILTAIASALFFS